MNPFLSSFFDCQRPPSRLQSRARQRAIPAGLVRCSLAAIALAGVALASEPVTVTPSYVNRLAEELRTNHPALRATAARLEAARAAHEAVRTWPDPMVRIGGMFAEDPMRAEDGDLIYGVAQKLPLFGRPGLARAVADAQISRESGEAEFRFQSLRRDLARTLFRTALAGRTLEIAEEDLAWLARMVQATNERYRAGAGSLPDLLRIQNELRKQQEQVETDRRQLTHEQLAVNRVLNRDLQSPWPPLQLPSPAEVVVYSPALATLARQYEPRLRVLRREVEQAEALSRLTRRERLPEVSLGAQGRSYTGNGEFRQAEVMLEFSFPWGNGRKYRRDYERDRARVTAAEQEAADYALGIDEELHALTVRIDAARRQALAYRDEILPRSEQSLSSTETAWITGRAWFLDVLEARRMLLEARLMYARSVAEQYILLSDLVLCCGLGDLEALDMIGAGPVAPAQP